MITEIRVPTLGESINEATIGRWLKQPGDAIKMDDPLVELETDKVSVEVPAPVAGVLTDIIAKEGENVAVGALLARLGEGGGSVTSTKKTSEKTVTAENLTESSSKPTDIPSTMLPGPAASKLIAEHNLNVEDISGTGKRGQVLKEDILKFIQKKAESTPELTPNLGAVQANSPEPETTGGLLTINGLAHGEVREERVRMTRLRQTIARRLKDAQNNAAMLTTFNEVDMSAVMELRKNYKDLFEKKHAIKLGFMGMFTKAICHALKEIPAINAEIDGQDIVYKNFCHIGVAVGTDKGLVVPVVHDADRMSVAGIEQTIGLLGQKARDGRLTIEDMQGGTFTISNGGVYGSLMSTPILNAPQSGILGMHKIVQRPIAVDGEILIRPMMYLALSYDHRIVDGKEAVIFLVRVKESLEDPQRLVLDL